MTLKETLKMALEPIKLLIDRVDRRVDGVKNDVDDVRKDVDNVRELPTATTSDAGKVPVVQSDGSWGLGEVEQDIPANIPQIQSATVGQTVVVKAVDENGMPTEWEAADVGGGESPVVVANCTITGVNGTTATGACDKTATEIRDLVSAGKVVYLHVNEANQLVPLVTPVTKNGEFYSMRGYQMNMNMLSDGTVLFVCTTVNVKVDGSVEIAGEQAYVNYVQQE